MRQLDSVDLLFLDISLPQESGLEFAAKIKSAHPDLAVSVLTMHEAPEYRQAAFEHGADYFVSEGFPAERSWKSCDPPSLIGKHAVQSLL
ncbi:MAG: response regulator [Gammaproteobacteria bacterium]